MKKDSKRFYVYVYLDQRKKGYWNFNNIKFYYKPFYVGIGNSYRINSHLTPFNLNRKSIKNNIIKSIIKETKEMPLHYKIFEDLSFEQAIKIEKDFICKFGRVDLKTGILSNMTEGGDGNLGLIHSEKYLNTLRKKIYQYGLDGNFIREFKSLKEASEKVKCSPANIRYAINNKKQAKNFQWRYKKYQKITKIRVYERSRLKYYMYDKQNNLIKKFNSYLEIAKYFNRTISLGNISSCCNNKIESYLGYKWKNNK